MLLDRISYPYNRYLIANNQNTLAEAHGLDPYNYGVVGSGL